MAGKFICLTFLLVAVSALTLPAEEGPRQYLKQSDAWFRGEESRQIAENILSHQAEIGGWPKGIDTTAAKFSGERNSLKPTFDNGATTDELRFLARRYSCTKDERLLAAFQAGFDYILKSQYATGGWPQFYPPGTNYHRHITFNDNVMIRLLEFLRETYTSDTYIFLNDKQRAAARLAFEKGIACILKCQIRVAGKLTAWCAQHDEQDYQPRPARKFEVASLSGAESVRIVRLLMSLDRPSPEVIQAVEHAVAWFESAKIQGLRVDIQDDPKSPTGKNKVVRNDAAAPPMWARFYEINSNKPIFVDRDGVVKYNLNEIGYERRNGYDWLGYWPQPLLEREYPAWKQKR